MSTFDITRSADQESLVAVVCPWCHAHDTSLTYAEGRAGADAHNRLEVTCMCGKSFTVWEEVHYCSAFRNNDEAGNYLLGGDTP